MPPPVTPRRLTLDAPHATEATVPVSLRLYRRTPTTWRCDRTDRPLLVPPFPTWTRETLQLLLQEVASWRPSVDGPAHKEVIECGIYRTAVGLEVRCAFTEGAAHFILSQFAREIGTACDIAEAWKQAKLAKGFEEITVNSRR